MRKEPPQDAEPMMHPLPESGIEGAETASLEEGFTVISPDAPVVGYTVKELLARMEGKIDVYAKNQVANAEAIRQMLPLVDEHEKRLKVLELKDLARGAVVAWRVGFWKAGVAVLGAATSFAVVWEALHHP